MENHVRPRRKEGLTWSFTKEGFIELLKRGGRSTRGKSGEDLQAENSRERRKLMWRPSSGKLKGEEGMGGKGVWCFQGRVASLFDHEENRQKLTSTGQAGGEARLGGEGTGQKMRFPFKCRLSLNGGNGSHFQKIGGKGKQ